MESVEHRPSLVISPNGLTAIVDAPEADLEHVRPNKTAREVVLTCINNHSVIFVHGFTGGPQRTWSAKITSQTQISDPSTSGERPSKIRRILSSNNGQDSRVNPKPENVYWPRDLLPTILPKARVLTYGYDTHIRHSFIGPSLTRTQVYDIAWDFLQEIAALRANDPIRPVIFVAHSLGGIVVKEMLRRSSGCCMGQTGLRATFESTIGLIFFGTPHRGAEPRGVIRSVAENLAKILGFRANQQIIDTLLPTSERLRELRDEFGPIAQLRGWRIHSFQEQVGLQVLNGAKVVDDPSSCMDLPTIETTQHIARNHMDMCRFSGPDDPEFMKVAHALLTMATATSACDTSVQPQKRLLGKPERKALLNSLAFDRIDARRLTIKNAHLETCKWLLDKPEYLSWRDATKFEDHHGFLWIRGHAGTGKSTLMKFALSREQKDSNKQGKIVISFFFHARGEVLERSVEGMYRSLLLQLFEKAPNLVKALDGFDSAYAAQSNHKWSAESLRSIFEEVIHSLGKMSLVFYIDALDECDPSQVGEMLSNFEAIGRDSVSSGKSVRICLSSRHYPTLDIEKGLKIDLEIQQGHKQDIVDYIECELKADRHPRAGELKASIQARANGVFMWVALVVEMLNRDFVRGRVFAVWETLEKLPTDLHSLFHNILTNGIQTQDEKDDSLLSIQWVLFSTRPLTPMELYVGILCGKKSMGRSRFRVEDWQCDQPTPEDMRRFITDASKGLIEVAGFSSTSLRTSTVQFIHESVRNFFQDADNLNRIWPDIGLKFNGQGHETLKQCCQTAFHHLDLERVEGTSSHNRQLRYPLLDYAVMNLFHHADKAQGLGYDQALFLNSIDIRHYISFSNLLQPREVRRHSPWVSLLYLLAEKDCPNLCKRLSTADYSTAHYLEPEVERHLCPLFAARAAGSDSTVKAFLELHAATISTRLKTLYNEHFSKVTSRFRIKRSFAARTPEQAWSKILESGDETMLFFLLTANRHPWPNPEEHQEGEISCDVRCLLLAARLGQLGIVKLLGALRVSLNSRDQTDMTPLSWASREGHVNVVDYLLSDRDVEVNVQDDYGRTPVLWAAKSGHAHIVQVLHQLGSADLDKSDADGWTPLAWAAEFGHLRTVKYLVESGKTKVDKKDHDGYTPLAWAATRGRLPIVRYLVQSGRVDVESRDGHGRTPLAVAATNNRLEVVEYLVKEAKADVAAVDNLGRNILSREAQLAKTGTDIIDMSALVLSISNGKCHPREQDYEGRSAISTIEQRIAELKSKERLVAPWMKVLRLLMDYVDRETILETERRNRTTFLF